MATHHVVIIGGGFAGLFAAQSLRHAPVEVTLIDRRNFHLFQPLLYQVATGGLSPGDIASPLRGILKTQKNCRVLLGEVMDFEPQDQRVILRDETIAYDSLILATGVKHSYFGHDEWEEFAPGLKTIEDATEMRRKILLAFEAAERETDPTQRAAWLTFVITGAGPTGVELAGALGEMAHYTMKNEFRAIDPAEARILLVEGTDRVLPPYPPDLSRKAEANLERLGVTILRNTFVTAVRENGVTIQTGKVTQEIPTHTVLWAAGIQASPLGRRLADRTGATVDRIGRIQVAPDLTLPGHPEIFVIGDLAHCVGPDGQPLPGVAPVAMQQGKYTARQIVQRLRGTPMPPFRYLDLGNMAVIGRAAAVVNLRFIRFGGFAAWLVWLFVHLMHIVEYENRFLVFIQWAWNYFTRNRGARLMTGQDIIQIKKRKL
ncbi:MAG: NAD(P)/FAD-dependent oxidoreductase [bacterium]|jgi:NADH dehydrogenase|nr:NAD(P)/FAD-dependent oxidoreductase [bacterium]